MRPITLINLAIISLLPAVLVAAPASAATKEQKMDTCKFGAEHDNLDGKKRDDFIKKCMANANYEPAARKEAMKKKPAAKKPAAASAPAPEEDKKQ
ncbi:MAG TPA: hypothetical protein VFC54_03775 [Pseudolabrys sp.]|nr:hypothetical protein [Pseudolabrys sp.]